MITKDKKFKGNQGETKMKNDILHYFNDLDNLDNVIDMIEEWQHAEDLGPKELEDHESGMNDDRFREFKALLLSKREDILNETN